MWRFWLNVVALNVGWFACVLGAANGVHWIGPATVALLIVLHVFVQHQGEADLTVVALAVKSSLDRKRLASQLRHRFQAYCSQHRPARDRGGVCELGADRQGFALETKAKVRALDQGCLGLAACEAILRRLLLSHAAEPGKRKQEQDCQAACSCKGRSCKKLTPPPTLRM